MADLPASFLRGRHRLAVPLPESVAAVKAAHADRVRASLNLAPGSALASIGLTFPVGDGVFLYLGGEPTLGLDAEGSALPLLTTGRATILRGVVNLAIFGAFPLLAALKSEQAYSRLFRTE